MASVPEASRLLALWPMAEMAIGTSSMLEESGGPELSMLGWAAIVSGVPGLCGERRSRLAVWARAWRGGRAEKLLRGEERMHPALSSEVQAPQ
mmetsp:Transcript_28331/g.61842  ORF Transcript_28331/g.61842 Transcript_28331/m.61842 type:complete len:93 (-) Transcript_28331:1074-1352(-)